jgi:hypothetical protein
MSPVRRRPATPVPLIELKPGCVETPFANVAEAAAYLRESKRTVRELVHRGVFKLAPNSNGREKPWRLVWFQIQQHATEQIRAAE